ncbi:hypothetical protein BWQ96_10521 [Gracilariopsis chorda]|uniref:Uncharacterized protein n=1 Tax=Gracilariopsis chorda TaxID=448386 RepID=A0A2V3ICG0_9FLOR|nr:hypothetical protein BWQ96_10521 [Gracilariopsis chorda]|eukprot:PXF39773.1 hypothetical protein BWQ96_10521 [Gracilariopsis chorda]
MKKSKPPTFDDAISTFHIEQAKERQRLDANRVEIEREKFELQQKESLQRLKLDQQRFELEKRERMQAMEERNKVLNIMDMLGQCELFAMEIDTEEAIKDVLMLASDFVAEGRRGAGVNIATKLGLEEFAALLDNAPPGIDELVALTHVMKLV